MVHPLPRFVGASLIAIVIAVWSSIASAQSVSLVLDAPWQPVESDDGRIAAKYAHPDGVTATLMVIDVDSKEHASVGKHYTSAAKVVAHWREAFALPEPHTQQIENTLISLGPLSVELATLAHRDRIGQWLGFSSLDLAVLYEDEEISDRFAYFLLCEGSGSTQAERDVFTQRANEVRDGVHFGKFSKSDTAGDE